MKGAEQCRTACRPHRQWGRVTVAADCSGGHPVHADASDARPPAFHRPGWVYEDSEPDRRPLLTRLRSERTLWPSMLSEAAEFLLAALLPLHQGICVDCAARSMERSYEESLKATKELIANGYALAGLDTCA